MRFNYHAALVDFMDEAKTAVRTFLGSKLKAYREALGMSVIELAAQAKVSRHYVYLVESGKANFTIDAYIEMLHACGLSFEDAIAGLRSSDIPVEHQALYHALATVLRSDIHELQEGARIVLQALAEKATRIERIRGIEIPPNPRPGKQE